MTVESLVTTVRHYEQQRVALTQQVNMLSETTATLRQELDGLRQQLALVRVKQMGNGATKCTSTGQTE